MATTRSIPTVRIGLVALALALGGCAETTFVGHTAKTMFPEAPEETTGGGYKVGTPYQIDGQWYTPQEDYSYSEVGVASWYGPDFHGKRTANGERYDMNALTAAHRTLPMPSLVRVTNMENGRSAILRVNDRGPFARSRVLDVSRRAADALGFIGQGTATVKVEILAEESLALKQRLLRGDTDFAQASTPVAPLAAVGGPATRVTAEELPPPTGATAAPAEQQQPRAVPAAVLAGRTPPSAAVPTVQTAAYRPAGQFVQVGAFSDAGNAERLRTRLGALGPVEISPAAAANGATLHRVRLGPFADAAQAQAALADAQRNGFPDARLVQP